MVINIVMSDDFTRVTSTSDYTLEEVYQMMDECTYYELAPCGVGYVSVSLYFEEQTN